jgi:hypothetical protein
MLHVLNPYASNRIKLAYYSSQLEPGLAPVTKRLRTLTLDWGEGGRTIYLSNRMH